MAKVIRREFYNVSRSDTFVVVPIGDTHVGAAACDEKALRNVVERIKNDDRCLWVGMGDACEFINMRDPRFSPGNLASWINLTHMNDLAAAQRDRYLEIVRPIASKCLAIVKGNHEESISKYYERDVYYEIVNAIKQEAGMPAEQHIAVGYYGWVRLVFCSGDKAKRGRITAIDINVHHGFTGGRLAGAKALNMQRWLWSHGADIVLFGHSHNTMVQPEAVEYLDQRGNIVTRTRKGCFAGTFLRTVNPNGPNTYSEIKGFMPLPYGGCEIWLHPHHYDPDKRIRIIA